MPSATGEILAQIRLEPAISHINESVDFILLFFILVESLGNDSHYVLQGIFVLRFARFQIKLLSASI